MEDFLICLGLLSSIVFDRVSDSSGKECFVGRSAGGSSTREIRKESVRSTVEASDHDHEWCECDKTKDLCRLRPQQRKLAVP